MSERKRQRAEDAARQLERCAEQLREAGASLSGCNFRLPSTDTLVALQRPSEASQKRLKTLPPSSSDSLFSLFSAAEFAAKSSAQSAPETWQQALRRLAQELGQDAQQKLERLERRHEALSGSVKLFQEKVKALGDDLTLQDKVETQLAQEEAAWEQQMQVREQKVAEKEVELKALKEEEEEVEEEESEEEEVGEMQEALALRAEEKRDIEAAIESLQRKRRRKSVAVEKPVDVEQDAAAAAREQVLRELKEEKDALQREIIAAEEQEEKQEENARDLPQLKDDVADAKVERAKVQAKVDALRLELARCKRKMRFMVDVQLLTARDTNPPTLREEAVLLHLLYEHEGEMGVNELKQEASKVLQEHSRPNGNGVVIRALYSLVANGVVQIDRSYGNGLVTSLLV